MTISAEGISDKPDPTVEHSGNQHHLSGFAYQQQGVPPALVTVGLHSAGRFHSFAINRWLFQVNAIATKSLGGTTRVEGTLVPRKVRVYRRDNGAFVDEFDSTDSGLFWFQNIAVPGVEYILICLDDDLPEDFNDLIFAKVTGVDSVAVDPNWKKDAGS